MNDADSIALTEEEMAEALLDLDDDFMCWIEANEAGPERDELEEARHLGWRELY